MNISLIRMENFAIDRYNLNIILFRSSGKGIKSHYIKHRRLDES
jgi:hypothetical protein